MNEYLVIFEETSTGWSAYAPDLPGLGVAGDSLEEVETLVAEAIQLHIEHLREHGDPVPAPTTRAKQVRVA